MGSHFPLFPADRLIENRPVIDARQGGPCHVRDIGFSSDALGQRQFICACGRKCFKLYEVDGVWRCRTCHKLDWSSRHTRCTLPGHARIQHLRRRIGAEPCLFGTLPTFGRQAYRKRAIAAEINRLEAELILRLRHRRIAVLALPRDGK